MGELERNRAAFPGGESRAPFDLETDRQTPHRETIKFPAGE